MSLTELESQALGSIEDGLAGSDPRLASMLTIFSRLAEGEEMPAREKIPVRRRRPPAHRPRRTRRHPRPGRALPQPHRLYPRLGRQQAMLLLWVVITAGLLAAALAFNTSGNNASCIQSMGTVCPSRASPDIPAGPVVVLLRRTNHPADRKLGGITTDLCQGETDERHASHR